jgi:hypothetical protein
LLLVMWWAFGVHGVPPAPTIEMKPDPFDNEASTSAPRNRGQVEAGPTDFDLGIDFEAFEAQVGRRCDLELDALCDKVLQDLEDDFEGTSKRDLDFDFEAFLAQVGRRCDLELDALCDKVLLDLEDELGGGPVCAQARRQPTIEEPWLDLEAKVELHCDTPLEGTCSNAKDANDWALDDMCAAVLEALEDECAEFGALDDNSQGDHM